MDKEIKQFQNPNNQVTEIKVHSQESGFPIYATSLPCPISYSTTKEPSTFESVQGVPGAFTLKNVLDAEECRQFVELTEKMGFGEAPITTGRGMVVRKDIRNNSRVIWQTEDNLWTPMWERIQNLVPAEIVLGKETWVKSGLNERFRFYKYEVGQTFNPHFDGAFPRNENETSLLTIIVYLTDDFEGGHTTFFLGSKNKVKVKPIKGAALVFHHGECALSPLHEGSNCFNGIKYVLRSDVMYKRKEPQKGWFW
eukprot:TRINITY_DN2868_c0_g1_i1.p1 TRINITY_DN2868_c0_g1~~TRINITY_DN2868_c0_g1_i1.p1  ORF type:complete len:275 (+),score=68.52 TRINITY_DN2868_c0_g1_i1:67-825(+)